MAGRKDALVAGIDSARRECTVVVRHAATGRLVRRGRAPHAPGAGPAQWWRALVAAIVDAGGFADVAAFAVAAQPGVVLLDADGVGIEPARVATPDELAAAAEGLVGEVGAAEFAARIGFVPTTTAPIARLRWLRDADPAAAARIEAVVAPHDWLTWRLRGFGPHSDGPLGPRLEELATDRSEVSATGWWNPATGRHEHGLFNRALGRAAIKPRVMRPDGWGGESAKLPEVGIRAARIIGVGGRRRAAAAFGLAAGPGDAIVFGGVAPAVVATADAPTRDVTGTVQGFADLSGRFLPEVTLAATPLGDAIDALRAAGVPVTRVLLADGDPDAAGRGIRIPRHLEPGVAVDTAEPGDHVADGMAAQAAWALTRRRPQWHAASAGDERAFGGADV